MAHRSITWKERPPTQGGRALRPFRRRHPSHGGREGGPGMRVIGRRFVFYLITALAAITVDFFIPRLMPGNPVEAILARLQGQITPGTVRALELQYGLKTTEGLWGQYVHYLTNILHGNLGVSTGYYPSTVTSVIQGALPWTVGLVGVATVISFILGTAIGALVA